MNPRFLALLGLSSCAPVLTTAPPVPGPDGKQFEAGAAVDLAYKLGYIGYVEPHGLIADTLDADATVHFAWSPEKLPGFTLGGVALGGSTRLGAGGAFFRYMGRPHPRVALSGQIDGGWLWAGLGVSAAFEAWPRGWVYVAPGLDVYTMAPGVRVPVGVSAQLSERFGLNGELGWRFGDAGLYDNFSAFGQDRDDVQQVFHAGFRALWYF